MRPTFDLSYRWRGSGDLRTLALALACVLLLSQPARSESDWAREAFSALDGKRAIGAQPSGQPGGGGRGSKSALVRPDGSGRAGDGKADEDEKAKENVFVRPDLPPGKGQWQWRILKASWSVEDESAFEDFVRIIGESDCTTVHECITSAGANPRYHVTNPPFVQFHADCADLPGFLRGYFAWKNGLPFSFSIKFAAHPRAPGSRTGTTGNQITDRYDIVGPGPDARRALPLIGQYVSTEHFRTPPAYTAAMLPDYYPVALTRDSIRPGTVIFDPDGHVAVVYKVSANGLIHYIDAHPDNSLTRGIYGRDFARAVPEMGAGFKRWRPQELKGATRAADGTLIGGRIELKPDRALADWSDEQFYGTEQPRPRRWENGKFFVHGHEADYYDYLRLKLAGPDFKYDPLDETRTRMRALCYDLRERVQAVDLAIRAGYHRRPQPPKLPPNIYATSGDWEVYSTPSRDARMKTSFEELRDDVARFLDMAASDSRLLDYAGKDLRGELRHLYDKEAAACVISYVKSDGSTQTLSFRDVVKRLFKMSFDPYHCVELRWGASSAQELKSCQDGPEKRAWYAAEERLRNQVTRTYGEPMGWTLAQLQNKQLDIGFDEAPDVDVESVLDGTATVVSVAAPSVGRSGRLRRGGAAARPGPVRLVVPTGHRP
jgi:hypothetical protein